MAVPESGTMTPDEDARENGDALRSAGDRQWAWRQAAEAQNHIFDRCVLCLFSV